MVLVKIETPKQCIGCDYLKRIPTGVYLEHYWPVIEKKLTPEELRWMSKGWRSSGCGYSHTLVCTKNTYCKHLKFVKKIKKLEEK